MSHSDIFDATNSFSSVDFLDHTPTFRRDNFMLTLHIDGATVEVDVRRLLHHASCVTSVDKVGDIKLAVRNGRFTGVDASLNVYDGIGVSRGKEFLGVFDNMTEAALARAKNFAPPSSFPPKKKRRVIIDDDDDARDKDVDDVETSPARPRPSLRVQVPESCDLPPTSSLTVPGYSPTSPDYSPTSPPASPGRSTTQDCDDVEIVNVVTLDERNKKGFANAINLDED